MGCRKLDITSYYRFTGPERKPFKRSRSLNGRNPYYRHLLNVKFIWGEDLSGSLQGAGGVGGLLLVADSTNTYAPVHDANGNVTGYIDANTGAEVASYEMSPFGKTITKSGSKADEFDYKFSTKPEDQETGLYYYTFSVSV